MSTDQNKTTGLYEPLENDAVKNCNVLVVDDDPGTVMFMSDFLESLGFNVANANSVTSGIAQFDSLRPDIILTDYNMPGGDGIELIHYVRAQKLETWTTIIVLSGLDEMDKVVSCLHAGANDYMTKPVNLEVLKAKIGTYTKLAALQQDNLATKTALETAYSSLTIEQELAESLLSSILQRAPQHQYTLDYWLESASRFSGDLIAVNHCPDGNLYFILSDVTGHDLSASFTTLLISQIFHDMVERACELEAITSKLNRVLYELLPTNIFTAACVGKIDVHNNTLSLWSGGIPDLLVVDTQGNLVDQLPAQQPALGILPAEVFDSTLQQLQWQQDVNLLIYSDGVIECEDENGVKFGEQRLVKTLRGQTHYQSLLQHLQHTLKNYTNSLPFDDDVAVLCLQILSEP